MFEQQQLKKLRFSVLSPSLLHQWGLGHGSPGPATARAGSKPHNCDLFVDPRLEILPVPIRKSHMYHLAASLLKKDRASRLSLDKAFWRLAGSP